MSRSDAKVCCQIKIQEVFLFKENLNFKKDFFVSCFYSVYQFIEGENDPREAFKKSAFF